MTLAFWSRWRRKWPSHWTMRGPIAKLLLSWSADRERESTASEVRSRSSVTHEEIAQMIGSSRETVTRLLSELKKEKRIDSSGRINFGDPQSNGFGSVRGVIVVEQPKGGQTLPGCRLPVFKRFQSEPVATATIRITHAAAWFGPCSRGFQSASYRPFAVDKSS